MPLSCPDPADPVVFSASASLAFRVLRSTEELEATAHQWIELRHRDPHRRPFQRPEWLLPWRHQFGRPGLRALTVYAEDQLLALLPFYIHTDPATRERQLLLLGAGTTNYLDGVYAPECTPDHVLAACATS